MVLMIVVMCGDDVDDVVKETDLTSQGPSVVMTENLEFLSLLEYVGISLGQVLLLNLYGHQWVPGCVMSGVGGHHTSMGGCNGMYGGWESLQVLA